MLKTGLQDLIERGIIRTEAVKNGAASVVRGMQQEHLGLYWELLGMKQLDDTTTSFSSHLNVALQPQLTDEGKNLIPSYLKQMTKDDIVAETTGMRRDA